MDQSLDRSYGLPQSIVRNLSDRLYEKRKTAALEIEQMMKEMFHNGDMAGIEAVLKCATRNSGSIPHPLAEAPPAAAAGLRLVH